MRRQFFVGVSLDRLGVMRAYGMGFWIFCTPPGLPNVLIVPPPLFSSKGWLADRWRDRELALALGQIYTSYEQEQGRGD